ncbi:MAG TPA: DUF4384 domain-containing protein [Thermoanaerobaculia bacterium]|nr:DUF4384 domain-containing protein [Thermoanaerobaculia bacterium]
MRWLLLLLVLATDSPTLAEEAGAKAMFRNPSLDVLTIPARADEAKPRRKEPDKLTQPKPAPPGKDGVRPPRPAKPEPVRSIGIRSWIRRVDGRGNVLADLSAGHIFRSRERIQLVVESNTDAYLAVVQQGSDGRVGLLFPAHESGLGADRIPAHVKVILPGPRHAFTFDERAGTERLLIVLVRDRWELAELPLRREMRPEDFEALRQVAARELGAKNLIIEALADFGEDPATYTVNRAGSAIVQEFALVHEK